MTPVSCDHARAWISDLLAGEISLDEQAALESHQAGCDACRADFDLLLLQDRALGELAGERLSESLKARIRPALAAARKRRSWAALMGAAAVLLVFSKPAAIATLVETRGEVVLLSGESEEGIEAGTPLTGGQGLRTRGAGSLAIVRFQDETELKLGEETTVERIEEGPGKQVRLTGGVLEASVVAQPAGRPMVLSSSQARATVLGTRLRLVVEEETRGVTRLEVEEGSVRLTRIQDGASVDVPAGSFSEAARGQRLVARPLRTSGKATVVKAGETLTLAEDLVLTGDDTLEIQGGPERRCVLAGNRHRIRSSGEWTGWARISHCDFKETGDRAAFTPEGKLASQAHALDLAVSKDSDIVLEHCTFSRSASVRLHLDGRSSARIVGNLCHEDSVVSVDKAVEKSVPFFLATGSSAAPKVFQGNRVYRSGVHITGKNWKIGGETDAESNLIIGLRAGLFAYGEGTVVRGNYLHVRMPRTPEYPYWSQVATFTTAKGALAEHNVIRDGEWIVQFVEGEFRHNLICDINDHNLLRNASTGRIHHNIFVAGKPGHPPGSMGGCIFIVYAPKPGEEGAEIFNNTFDAGGTMNVPGIEVNPGGFVKSLRNNVFHNFGHQEKFMKFAQAMVRPTWTEPLTDPPPVRLGYADYNLFYSPLAKVKKNYALGVAGKSERKDAGFGLNDVPRGGSPNDQADPKFKGPIPLVFAFNDEDIVASRVTVSRILEFYRAMYTPDAGSPLIDAGDPADGEGTDIGAVDAGKPASSK